MFTTFRSLAKLIQDKMADLVWIDRDKGQLENPETFETVQVPGLLLSFGKVDWEGLTRGDQKGLCTMTAKLVFRLPFSTYEGADWNDYPEFEEFTERLHTVLSGLPGVGDRRSSQDYFTKLFYISEQAYDLTVYHRKEVKTIQKPAPTIVSTIHIQVK